MNSSEAHPLHVSKNRSKLNLKQIMYMYMFFIYFLRVAAPHRPGFNVTLQPWFDLQTTPNKVGYNLTMLVDRDITRYHSIKIYRRPADASAELVEERTASGTFLSQILSCMISLFILWNA